MAYSKQKQQREQKYFQNYYAHKPMVQYTIASREKEKERKKDGLPIKIYIFRDMYAIHSFIIEYAHMKWSVCAVHMEFHEHRANSFDVYLSTYTVI